MAGEDVRRILLENLAAFEHLYPLLILAGGSLLLLILCTFLEMAQKFVWVIYALVIAAALSTVEFSALELMSGDLRVTAFSGVVQMILLAFSLLLLVFEDLRKREAEYHFLLLSVLLGSLLMILAHNLLVIYLSVELTSLGSYLLTAFSDKKKSYEASMKYLLTGAISSAVMIYGMSLIYGTHGTLLLSEVTTPVGLSLVGWILLIAGILFKVSILPFHLWVPNTYQLAPTAAVTFFSVVPKIGAFVLLGNIVRLADSTALDQLVLLLALLTIVMGTFSAISQTSLKRLLAYGALAHSGFLLPLVVFPGVEAQSAFVFYAVVYAVMNLAIFHFVAVHEGKKDLQLIHLNRLGNSFPLVGAAGVIVVLALIGLPPTGGFSIKLLLFANVWDQFQASSNILLVVYFIVGILSTAISLYFYLKVPYHYFLVKTEGQSIKLGVFDQAITTFLAMLLLWFFLQPGFLNNIVVTIGTP